MSETSQQQDLIGVADLKSAEVTTIRRRRAEDYSHNYQGKVVVLNTQEGQRLLETRYERINLSLERLQIAFGIARFNDYAKDNNAKLQALFDELKAQTETSLMALTKTVQEHSRQSDAEYFDVISHPRSYRCVLRTRFAKNYVEMVELFDRLMQQIDKAHIFEIINDEENLELRRQWVERYSNFFFAVRNLHFEVWKTVMNQRNEENRLREQKRQEASKKKEQKDEEVPATDSAKEPSETQENKEETQPAGDAK